MSEKKYNVVVTLPGTLKTTKEAIQGVIDDMGPCAFCVHVYSSGSVCETCADDNDEDIFRNFKQRII